MMAFPREEIRSLIFRTVWDDTVKMYACRIDGLALVWYSRNMRKARAYAMAYYAEELMKPPSPTVLD